MWAEIPTGNNSKLCKVQSVLTQAVANRTSLKSSSYWPSLRYMSILRGYLM